MPCNGADARRRWQQECGSVDLKTFLLSALTPSDAARTLQEQFRASGSALSPHGPLLCHTQLSPAMLENRGMLHQPRLLNHQPMRPTYSSNPACWQGFAP